MSAFAQQADTTAQKAPWKVHAELNGFIYPNRADSYIDPIVWAKKGHLHLETRYNYEDLQTVSLYGGYNLAFGKKIAPRSYAHARRSNGKHGCDSAGSRI